MVYFHQVCSQISHVAPGHDDLGADVGAQDLLREHHEVGRYLGADLDGGLLVPGTCTVFTAYVLS